MTGGCYLCGHAISEHTRWLYPPHNTNRPAHCLDCLRCIGPKADATSCPPQTTNEG